MGGQTVLIQAGGQQTRTPNDGCALSVTNSSIAPSSGTNTSSDSCSRNTSSTTTAIARTEGSTNGRPMPPKTSLRSAQANRSNVTPPAPDSSTNTEPPPKPLPGQPTPPQAPASTRPTTRAASPNQAQTADESPDDFSQAPTGQPTPPKPPDSTRPTTRAASPNQAQTADESPPTSRHQHGCRRNARTTSRHQQAVKAFKAAMETSPRKRPPAECPKSRSAENPRTRRRCEMAPL